MAYSWTYCMVGEFEAKGEAEIKTGPFGTQLKASDYVESGTPMINARNIGFRQVRAEKLEYLSNETVQRLSSHLLDAGDIVFGRKGTAERHVLITLKEKGWFQGTDCLRLRKKSPSVDNSFLSYSFLLSGHQQWMINHASHGATMTSLNQDIIRRIPLRLPPLPVQRRVAQLLSAYDDLIENNTRRIKILERMAQALYREWFVHFRFPGHAKVKRVASPLGPIPQGWRVARLEELTTYLNRGLAPSYAEDGGLVINQKCIRNGRLNLDLARHQSKTVPEDKLVRAGDVLINSTGEGTLGRVAQVCENIESCTVDTHVTIVRPRPEIDPDFFGLSLIPKEDRFMKMGVGSTGQTEFSRQAIGDVQIVVPPSHERTTFGAVVRPIRQLVLTLERRNANLRRTRDLLLPKLISGALDVSKLDLETGSERGIHSAAPREGSTPAE